MSSTDDLIRLTLYSSMTMYDVQTKNAGFLPEPHIIELTIKALANDKKYHFDNSQYNLIKTLVMMVLLEEKFIKRVYKKSLNEISIQVLNEFSSLLDKICLENGI